MSGLVPKDEFFAKEGVMAVQVTDKMHFKRLEGLLRTMMAMIIAMLPSVKYFTVYRDLLCLIGFSHTHKNILK